MIIYNCSQNFYEKVVAKDIINVLEFQVNIGELKKIGF